MLKLLIVAFFSVAHSANIPIFPGQCRTPADFGGVHTNFRLNDYLGTWYEIERYEQIFSFDGECVTAQYTNNTNPDGVRVVNTKRLVDDGRWVSEIGLAVLTQPDEVPLPALLSVVFPINGTPPERSNYWVLRTDYVNYAIVVSCAQINPNQHTDFYWFLSRQHPPSAEARRVADEIIENHLKREYIRPTLQDIAACFAPQN